MKRKLLKKFLFICCLLCVAFAFSAGVSAAVVDSGTCGDNLTWSLDSNGTLTISGTGTMTNWRSDSATPWYSYQSAIKTIDIGYGVTSIGSYAFENCGNMTKVTIPDSMISIEARAFCNCAGLSSVTIPSSVTFIGISAFSSCTGLVVTVYMGTIDQWIQIDFSANNNPLFDAKMLFTPVGGKRIEVVGSGKCGKLGENVRWILGDEGTLAIFGSGVMADWNSFLTTNNAPWYSKNTSIETVKIGSAVMSIGDYAFENCRNMTKITIPDSITTIGDYAFSTCESLINVMIPSSVTSIGDYMFIGCNDLSNVIISENVTSIGSHMFYGCDKLTHITIPNSVTSIGDGAFWECQSLTSITIPDSVATIGSYAFYGCVSLLSITIPDSVVWIGDNTFSNCDNLINISVDAENNFYCNDEAGVLFDKDKTKLIRCPVDKKGVYIIPEGVTSIESSAFEACTGLTSITIPDGVTSIGDYAFYNCSGLTNITIPDSVTNIGNLAFLRCSSLKNVTIPEGVSKISGGAFEDCISLTTIIIPDSVTLIVGDAFKNCQSLKTVYYAGTKEQWSKIDIAWGNTKLKNAKIIYSFDKDHPFGDVKKSDFFYNAVYWAFGHDPQITKGTDDTHFAPGNTCTRGQVVTFLWRAMGEPAPKSTSNPFKDVKSTDYFYKAVLWAVENDVTSGTGAGKFSPNDPCTRGQVVTFLWRAEGQPEPQTAKNPFNDVKTSDFFYKAVLWAVENDVTGGTGAGKFSPAATCTRGQVVTFLYRDLAE